jgi:hypothetical protein
MVSWRRRVRALALSWAVLQFALPMAVLFADASTALGSVGRARSHVESSGETNCRAPHTDECALCRFLSNTIATAARADVVLPATLESAGTFDAPVRACTPASRLLPQSRAPPVV